MAGFSPSTLGACAKMLDDNLNGLPTGYVVRGKNCRISNITQDLVDSKGTYAQVTFAFYADGSTTPDVTQKAKLYYGTDGEDGRGIDNIVAVDGGLKITYTDGSTNTLMIDLGETKFSGKAGQAIGGIKLNETFTDVPLTEMWKKLLQAPYTKPSLTLGFSPTKTLYDKVEETVSEITISTNVTKNTNEIANVKFYVNDVVVHTISDDSVKNGGVFTYKHTFTTPTNSNFTVKASVTDKLVDDNGNQTVTSGLGKINFVAGSYFGIVPDEDGTGYTPTEASIKALTKTVKNAKTYNDTISGTKARFVYAYPKELGALTSILDTVNNFQYFTSTTQEEITVDGIAYYVYYLTNRVTFTDVTLKFS